MKRLAAAAFAAFLGISLTAGDASAGHHGGHHGFYGALAAVTAFALLYPLFAYPPYYRRRRYVAVEEGPVSLPPLSAHDRAVVSENTRYTLEKIPSGREVRWRNPRTGYRGTVVARPAFRNRLGQYCRDYRQTFTYGGRTRRAYGTACRGADGNWRNAY